MQYLQRAICVNFKWKDDKIAINLQDFLNFKDMEGELPAKMENS